MKFRFSLSDSIREKLDKLLSELVYFEDLEEEVATHKEGTDTLLQRIKDLYVFGPDQEAAEGACKVSDTLTCSQNY